MVFGEHFSWRKSRVNSRAIEVAIDNSFSLARQRTEQRPLCLAGACLIPHLAIPEPCMRRGGHHPYTTFNGGMFEPAAHGRHPGAFRNATRLEGSRPTGRVQNAGRQHHQVGRDLMPLLAGLIVE